MDDLTLARLKDRVIKILSVELNDRTVDALQVLLECIALICSFIPDELRATAACIEYLEDYQEKLNISKGTGKVIPMVSLKVKKNDSDRTS